MTTRSSFSRSILRNRHFWVLIATAIMAALAWSLPGRAAAQAQTPGITVNTTEVWVVIKRTDTEVDQLAFGQGITLTSTGATQWVLRPLQTTGGVGLQITSGGITPGDTTQSRAYINTKTYADGVYTGANVLEYEVNGVWYQGPTIKWRIGLITGEYIDQWSYYEPTKIWQFQRPDKLAHFNLGSVCPKTPTDMQRVFPNTTTSEWRFDVDRWHYNGALRELTVPYGILVKDQHVLVSSGAVNKITTDSAVWVCRNPHTLGLAPNPPNIFPVFDDPINETELTLLILMGSHPSTSLECPVIDGIQAIAIDFDVCYFKSQAPMTVTVPEGWKAIRQGTVYFPGQVITDVTELLFQPYP